MQINREVLAKVLRHGAVLAQYGSVALLGVAIGYGVSDYRSKKRIGDLQEELTKSRLVWQRQIKQLGDTLKDRTDEFRELSASLDKVIADKGVTHLDVPMADPLPFIEEDDNPMVVLRPAKVFNIFPDPNVEPWDQEKENKKRERHQGRPYIISVEEFQENETDFPQQTVTFYEGDQVLTDQEDVPIYNHGNVVGELIFGYGSGDPNIVYVRNPRGRVEYEVLRDHGHYASEVLGHEIETQHEEADLKHAHNYRLRGDD